MIESRCGLCCSSCEFKETEGCRGCIETNGHPFHGECRLAQCSIEKKIRYCGECKDFPCELLKAFSFDENFGDNPKGARIEKCRKWNEEK